MEKPNFDDMTPKQVREWGSEIGHQAAQFGELRATLIVNCRPGRALHGVGIAYDESKPVLKNLVSILEQLVDKAKSQSAMDYLSLSADGVRIAPGMMVHHPTEGSLRVTGWKRDTKNDYYLILSEAKDPVPVGDCYKSKDAMEAARGSS